MFAPGVERRAFRAELPISASLVAQEFSGFLVDEMKPGAGETDDGHIGIGTGGIGTGLVLRRGRRKPMLYVGAQPRTFEKDVSAHTRNMQNSRGGSPPYGCVVGGVRLEKTSKNKPPCWTALLV
jgi:hypothetical protein